jgi:hypothetical protein
MLCSDGIFPVDYILKEDEITSQCVQLAVIWLFPNFMAYRKKNPLC